MLSKDLYIVTPFTRPQLAQTGNCMEYPDPKYTTYQIFVFESRIQPFLDQFFRNKPAYKYDHFVYIDIPFQGVMITTIQLRTKDANHIQIPKDMIREINHEISIMITLHPNYCLFYSDHSTYLSTPWVRALLPSFIFERDVYEFFKEPEKKLIPSVVQNGKIYLDLSDDINYEEVVQKLSSELNHTLEDFYKKGTLPEMLSEVSCIDDFCKIIDDPALYKRVPGEFLHHDGKLGDEIMDQLAGLTPIEIPPSDDQLISSYQKSISIEKSNNATVYVINFTKVDLNMNLTESQIGTEFLVSLKNFLEADAVISKEITPGYFEVYVNKGGKYLESSIQIKEMFGFQFLTHHPIGLLVAQDMGLLQYTKIIYDSYSNRGGVFVPMIYLGDVVELDLLKIQLTNRMKTVDAYTYSTKIEKAILKHQLNVVSKIDQYLFVEKSPVITKRVIYRSLEEKKPEMLIVGDWDFIQMNAESVIEIVNEILQQHKINAPKGTVRKGPFSSLIVPVFPRLIMERLIEVIQINLKQKYNFGRQF